MLYWGVSLFEGDGCWECTENGVKQSFYFKGSRGSAISYCESQFLGGPVGVVSADDANCPNDGAAQRGEESLAEKRDDSPVVDAEIVEFYGGSVLAFASKSGSGQSESMKSILAEEAEADVVQSLRDMNRVLLTNRAELLNLLVEIRTSGKRVAGVGAPMKASTLPSGSSPV